MIQELMDLRSSIVEGRYEDALELVNRLDWMSKKATLRNIRIYLIRMLVHLIENQIEQRLTNSWVASIRDSVVEIQDLNLMDNQTSYYIKQEEWDSYLEDAFKDAIYQASVEVANGSYKPRQLQELVDKNLIFQTTHRFLDLTYSHSQETIRDVIDEEFNQLPGGEDWN